jgi:hypothetical protein
VTDYSGYFSSIPAQIREKAGLGTENGFRLSASDFSVATIRIQYPGLAVVTKVVFEFFGKDAFSKFGIDYRKTGFDTPQQIAFEPVSAGAIDLGFAIIGEPVDSAVFEKAADQGTDGNIIG